MIAVMTYRLAPNHSIGFALLVAARRNRASSAARRQSLVGTDDATPAIVDCGRRQLAGKSGRHWSRRGTAWRKGQLTDILVERIYIHPSTIGPLVACRHPRLFAVKNNNGRFLGVRILLCHELGTNHHGSSRERLFSRAIAVQSLTRRK